MGCTFCATGTMNLQANLTSGEIIEQVLHASRVTSLRGLVFMGMGEPLDNYDAVLKTIQAVTEPGMWGLASSRVCVSTVGYVLHQIDFYRIIPRIKDLGRDAPKVSLALSLHAPTQETRLKIVPTAKAYRVDRIIQECVEFINKQNEGKLIKADGTPKKGRHLLLEYVLIRDVNGIDSSSDNIDSIQIAAELGTLLKGLPVLLNVIPYNPTDVPYDYKPPTRSGADAFVERVREDGILVILRQTMGQVLYTP
jgi:adenine C2-methylase RlmN of 23S rRNA A2503 and tRNA A37